VLEVAGHNLYDSAVLIGPDGRTRLHHRRLSPGWHWPDSPVQYRDGRHVPLAHTPAGRLGVLLCGDVFNPQATVLARAAVLGVLLVPFSRGYDQDAPDDAAWQTEATVYAQTLAAVAPLALCVNHTGAGAVGGAFVVQQGQVTAQLTHGQAGLLMVDLGRRTARPRPERS
jgi:predicted amidohydrolase